MLSKPPGKLDERASRTRLDTEFGPPPRGNNREAALLDEEAADELVPVAEPDEVPAPDEFEPPDRWFVPDEDPVPEADAFPLPA